MKKNKFYNPVFERQKSIDLALTNATEIEKELLGKQETLKVIDMPIEHLMYRIENFRTDSMQEAFIAEKNEKAGYFRDYSESEKIQFQQHELLVPLTERGDQSLAKRFRTEKKHQNEPLLINNRGEDGVAVVVNGNRRLCMWRECYYTDPITYAHFETIQCALLPSTFDADKEAQIEFELQIAKEIKQEYNWINDRKAKRHLQTILTEKKGMSLDDATKQVAKETGIQESRLKNQLASYRLAREYLRDFLNLENRWDEVEDKEQAFYSLATTLNGKMDQTAKEEIKTLSFQVMAGSVKGRSKHLSVMAIGKNLQKIAKKVQPELPTPAKKTSKKKSKLQPARKNKIHVNPYEGFKPGEIAELIDDAIDEIVFEHKKKGNHGQELARIKNTIKTTNKGFDKGFNINNKQAYIEVIDDCVEELKAMKTKLERK